MNLTVNNLNTFQIFVKEVWQMILNFQYDLMDKRKENLKQVRCSLTNFNRTYYSTVWNSCTGKCKYRESL